MLEKFDAIRPYRDNEIKEVLERLLTDSDFLRSVANFYYPRLTSVLPPLMQWLARSKLRSQLKDVYTVRSMQDVIAEYMDKMIHDTTTKLTHSGMHNLDEGKNYLFISNHRDITMDPAFVNYMLYHAGYETLQIAIGDNLLKEPFVTDLMRLNKSFIVQRSLKGRELLQSLKLLSEYIHHCIHSGQNVWIAQREGRAKDGVDKTDPALLKMLAMSRRDLSFGQSLSELHLIPVAISYEYDACDILKAEELYAIQKDGSFTKNERTDIHSIVTGMIGFKGHVHVAFGSELEIDSDEPEAIAELIDGQILKNYRLSDANYIAAEMLQKEGVVVDHALATVIQEKSISESNRRAFSSRISAIQSKLMRHLLFGYANPLVNKLRSGYKL
ncbi:MAG: acyltransferase [Gammaproteobacteria bacterium]|nr:acyltransferase [Gammaproteobacteria bacterium]